MNFCVDSEAFASETQSVCNKDLAFCEVVPNNPTEDYANWLKALAYTAMQPLIG